MKGTKANLGTGAAQTLSIPSTSKNKEAAAEFLQWWGKPANVAKICGASGQVPPNTEAVSLLKQSVGTTDYWNFALAESPDLQGQPFCPGWLPMLGPAWDPNMFKYFEGKIPTPSLLPRSTPKAPRPCNWPPAYSLAASVVAAPERVNAPSTPPRRRPRRVTVRPGRCCCR